MLSGLLLCSGLEAPAMGSGCGEQHEAAREWNNTRMLPAGLIVSPSIFRASAPWLSRGFNMILGLTRGNETTAVAWLFWLIVPGIAVSPPQHGSMAHYQGDMGTHGQHKPLSQTLSLTCILWLRVMRLLLIPIGVRSFGFHPGDMGIPRSFPKLQCRWLAV